ncbi:hypothetical protein ACE02D_19605 [Shewanella bicestrii]
MEIAQWKAANIQGYSATLITDIHSMDLGFNGGKRPRFLSELVIVSHIQLLNKMHVLGRCFSSNINAFSQAYVSYMSSGCHAVNSQRHVLGCDLDG